MVDHNEKIQNGFVYRRNSKKLLRSRIKERLMKNLREKPYTFDQDVVYPMSTNTLGDLPNLFSP